MSLDPGVPAPDDRRSPLHEEHVALGAALVPFAGWLMPLRYTSDLAEHTATRTAAGLFDLSHMGEIAVTGPGAGAALDAALVGNLGGLRVHGARYTMLCAEDGGVLDDLVVYRTGAQEYLVVANAANHAVVLAALTERAAAWAASAAGGATGTAAVTVTDRTDATALVAVQGPRALDVLRATAGLAEPADAGGAVTAAGATALGTGGEAGTAGGLAADGPLATLRYYACLPVTFAGRPVLAARTGYTGEDGFELFLDAADARALWRALLAAGAPLGLVPAGLAARDSLRLEAGMPLYGHELDTTTTPFEAGLGRVVRLDKTDGEGRPVPFVGRAALAARAGSAPARVLVGLQGLGRRAAREGHPVHAGEAPDAPRVGTVTSGAPSPTLGHPVAMAYVTPEVSGAGTALAVDVRGRREPVRVVPLPFYRRPR
ncbi:glycine cleavage system aminomethyltransferase GcvT [Cellulomonas endophytica]|uniref:glycine cleavage system aminomethyltransferase GcvT n=1 Tax=Cellulomonas endophytica TaxID=2494735 RepID=UPI001F0BAA44|nr:glycine cleavage system aminomethyltransferase GcvT [Cellulomonas endophytica]